jgi:hypothetical protein
MFLFIALLTMVACTDTGTSSSTSTDSEASTNVEPEQPTTPSLTPPDCQIDAEVLDGNRVWIKSKDVLAVVKADESNVNEEMGPSHRVLEILDGRSCEQKFQAKLPENTSPDFPYYIAEIQYNNVSNIIGIQGFYKVMICDLEQNYKLTELKPEFFLEREYGDPQSGMIQRLEVWEDYLLGYTQDLGAFAFDLSDRNAPKAVLPFAEWQDPDNSRYHSMFLLPTEGGVQAILPFYDAEEDNFMLYPLFDTPQQVSDQVTKSARNNQLLVLRKQDEGKTPIAIDLGARDLVDLPASIASKNTQEILKWMRAQQQ